MTLAEKAAKNGRSSLRSDERLWLDMVVNCQSKELGLAVDDVEDVNNNAALDTLDRMDLVGLFEELGQTWTRLCEVLQWPLDTFDFE